MFINKKTFRRSARIAMNFLNGANMGSKPTIYKFWNKSSTTKSLKKIKSENLFSL